MEKEKIIDLSEKKKEKENEKEAYAKPNVEEYGTLQELTQMPGGSTSTEGMSGRIHRTTPPRPPGPPPKQ